MPIAVGTARAFKDVGRVTGADIAEAIAGGAFLRSPGTVADQALGAIYLGATIRSGGAEDGESASDQPRAYVALHEQTDGVRLRADARHPLHDPRENLRVANRAGGEIVEGVVVPIHLRQPEHITSHFGGWG